MISLSLCLSAATRIPGFQLSESATNLLIITHSKRGQVKGKKHTHIHTHAPFPPLSCHSFHTPSSHPQTALQLSSRCYKWTRCPCHLPSPNWCRPSVATAMWRAFRRWSHKWRASARPSTSPACCLSTTWPWHTSRSKASKCFTRGCAGTDRLRRRFWQDWGDYWSGCPCLFCWPNIQLFPRL